MYLTLTSVVFELKERNDHLSIDGKFNFNKCCI